MACSKTLHYPAGVSAQGLLFFCPYKLDTTNDQLASRAGLLVILSSVEGYQQGRFPIGHTEG